MKHYALNSIEDARFSVDVTVDDEALHEVYLPHFRAVIDAGADAVMSAYNSVNGQWAGQNRALLTGILREEWGFAGFVMTDFIWGLRDPADSLAAGQDLEMPFRQQRARPFIEANREREWLFEPSQRLPAQILEEADRTGLRGLGVPARYGGVGLDPATEAQTFSVIATEIARGDSGLADKLVQNWKISVLLRSLAAPHLQDEWFPRYLADPQFLMAHCLTEPRGASDRWLPYNVPEAGMDTRAVHEGGHWTINGRKQFISNGYDASLYVVYASTDHSVGMLQGTSSFLVPRDTPGLEVTRCNETVGGRYMNNGEIVFDDCRVPGDHLLARGDALGKAGVYFRPGKIIQAAKNLGIGIAAFEDTAAWVQQRVQGGRILIRHQAVALRVAAMATRLEAVSALLQRAAVAVDENHPDATRLCDMVKVFASQEILEVCRHAVELHGGYGAMLEVGVEKYLRDAAVYLHMDATADISNLKIAKALFPATAGTYAGPQ